MANVTWRGDASRRPPRGSAYRYRSVAGVVCAAAASPSGHLEPWRFVGALQGSVSITAIFASFGNAELSAVKTVWVKARPRRCPGHIGRQSSLHDEGPRLRGVDHRIMKIATHLESARHFDPA